MIRAIRRSGDRENPSEFIDNPRTEMQQLEKVIVRLIHDFDSRRKA